MNNPYITRAVKDLWAKHCHFAQVDDSALNVERMTLAEFVRAIGELVKQLYTEAPEAVIYEYTKGDA